MCAPTSSRSTPVVGGLQQRMRRASCLNTSIIQIPASEFFHPWLWHTHTTCGQTCHDGCAARDRSPSPHPGPPPTRQIIRWPSATLHRAVISTFSPQMGGRAHDSSRQSIGCQISIVGLALPPCSAPEQQETRPVSSPRLTRHSAPATASFSDRVCARNPHILYLPVSHPPQ